MIDVVNQGTGRTMQLAGGIQAAAKTGTAQLNSAGEPQRSHAWIIGFAPAEAPRYAVAVMLKGTTDEISASTGGKLAGPIAKQILDHLFAHRSGGRCGCSDTSPTPHDADAAGSEVPSRERRRVGNLAAPLAPPWTNERRQGSQ